MAGVICRDRGSARQFIQLTRADILHQLKIPFRELVMTEAFHLEGDAYYVTLASDSSNTNDKAPKRKRQRIVIGKRCPPLYLGDRSYVPLLL